MVLFPIFYFVQHKKWVGSLLGRFVSSSHKEPVLRRYDFFLELA